MGNSDSFFRRQYGGMPVWSVMIAAALALVLGVFALLAVPQRGPASAAAPSQTRFTPSTPPPITRDYVNAYMIGDSVTGGSGTGGQPVTPGEALGTALNWNVEYDAVGGSGFVAPGRQLDEDVFEDRSMSTRLPAVVAANPDVVIVAAGRNDNGEDLAEVQIRIDSFFGDLRAQLPEATIVTVSPWLWDIPADAEFAADIDAISTHLRQVSEEVGAVYIDSRTDIWRVNQTNASTVLSADGWHPNAAGYTELGVTLAQALYARGLPRGPERWSETAPLSGEWHDPTDALFAPPAS